LKKALGALTLPVSENERIVFMVCHEFHRKREWLASKVDEWLCREGMMLLPDSDPPTNSKVTRSCITDRGGFGTIARIGKAQAVSTMMRSMQLTNHWSLSTILTTNKTQTSKQGHSYEERRIIVGLEPQKYYLVRTTPKTDDEGNQRLRENAVRKS
jgi:hypothetical protein